jgi:leucyl-tRNA synthetase
MCYLEGFYKGIMMVGPCAGKRVEEAKPIIKEMMIQEGMAVLYHEPEGEVVSRSGD